MRGGAGRWAVDSGTRDGDGVSGAGGDLLGDVPPLGELVGEDGPAVQPDNPVVAGDVRWFWRRSRG